MTTRDTAAQALTNKQQRAELPPLPSPEYDRSETFSGIRLYSQDQMREYAREAIAADRPLRAPAVSAGCHWKACPHGADCAHAAPEQVAPPSPVAQEADARDTARAVEAAQCWRHAACMFSSAIKSGKSWSSHFQDLLDRAKAADTAVSATKETT